MRIFGGERIIKVMDRLKVDEDTPVENRIISKSLEGAQKKVEGFNFDTRKNVVQYDDVMNRHRKATYSMRSEILRQADISKRVREFIHSEAKDLANSPIATTDHYEDHLKEVFPLDEKTLDRLFDLSPDKFAAELEKEVDTLYKEQEKRFGSEVLRKVERDIYLQILDNFWMQHLENMDHLREGIHWMGVGQRDPLVEYRQQSQRIFEDMQLNLRHEIVRNLFNARPISQEELDRAVETDLTRAARASVDNADKIIEGEEFQETDFRSGISEEVEAKKAKNKRRKSHKAERQRRAKARKRKK
jgi:preprotein translocase subunit SecA